MLQNQQLQSRTKNSHLLSSTSNTLQQITNQEEFDVIVIGSGIGGLSAAALSAKYGFRTLCVEAHDVAGGCAHSFTRYSPASRTQPFRFDSGPSLLTGLSRPSTNPLRQVLDAIGTADEIEWKTYNGWLVHDTADNSVFKLTTGDTPDFERAIEQKAGYQARQEFRRVRDKLLEPRGLSEASTYIPPLALRGGLGAVASLAQYSLKMLSIGTNGLLLTGPFSKILDRYNVETPFVRQWFDYLSFALSGLDAAHTQAAPVAYMMADLHRPGAVLDYPMGGMDALVQALVRGLQKHGGELRLNRRVDQFLLKEVGGQRRGECAGVILDNGQVIRARRGVVCNAPLWNMARLLEDSLLSTQGALAQAVQEVRQQADRMNMTRSFMHLHLGIPKDGLPPDLECHHTVLNMSDDVTAEQNTVIISIPTVFDPSLAPEGYHVVHAYTAACDAFEPWQEFLDGGVDTGQQRDSPNTAAAATYHRNNNARYEALKTRKSEVLWQAVARVIPDVRRRANRRGSVVMIGTPLTHRRYNYRYRGAYGPAPRDGQAVWELPSSLTKIQNLVAAGDTTFPGIGLPGVAASGTIAANTLAPLKVQNQLIQELQRKGALQ